MTNEQYLAIMLVLLLVWTGGFLLGGRRDR